jgi:hypothetical protein
VSNRAEMLMNDCEVGTEDSSFMFGCNGAGADGLSVAVLPQQFPIGGYERSGRG